MRSVDRALTAVWLVAAVAVGAFGYLAFAISDAPAGRRTGIVLLLLAALAVLVGGLLLARPGPGVLRASLAASLVWLLGGIFAAASMEFTTDRLLLGGLPFAVALVTAALSQRALRD
jgi:hypothetical protein